MKILFVADGRSPTAVNWMRYFCERGDEVILATTFQCDPTLNLSKKIDLPVAFSSLKTNSSLSKGKLWGAGTLKLRTLVKQWLGPSSISKAARQLRRIIEEEKPDLVHAMRIPFEGMVAADAFSLVPLVISVWGNDFTLHAKSNSVMRHYTEWAMKVATALHTDCHRDVRLAKQYGFSEEKPVLVIPGSGGIRSDIFYAGDNSPAQPLIVNPRGFRAYVDNDSFFKSIPLVLREYPQAKFVCPGMAGEPQVLQWIDELGIADAVELLPALDQSLLAELFRNASIVVSPTTHDGTPNSLIEAIACGCFPVAGDIESIREWISDGENGYLVDATQPAYLAERLVQAIRNEPLRIAAKKMNQIMIRDRAEYTSGMEKALAFYEQVMRSTT
jgi:glycosyltransferase involved in cell wall biosynthesis